MLKIKDNVDLKELEKFGFVLDDWHKKDYRFDRYDATIYVDKKTRIITMDAAEDYGLKRDESIVLLVLLFDLIQAGLVEKVKE